MDKERLEDILQAIADIEEVAAHGRATFLQSRLLQGSALYRFHILGEAAARLSPELQARYPNVEWGKIKAFRNLVIHDYDRVDFGIVAGAMAVDIPALKLDVQAILRDLGDVQ